MGAVPELTKVHLHEIVAAVLAVILGLGVVGLAVAEKEIPDVLANGFFAAMAYVFGTRASTTLERVNNRKEA